MFYVCITMIHGILIPLDVKPPILRERASGVSQVRSSGFISRGRGTEPAGTLGRTEIAGLNECWSMDFVTDTLSDGRRFRALTIVDNFSRECLGIKVDQSIRGQHVAKLLERSVSTVVHRVQSG
jgi:transposase InsO family protein